MPDSKSIYVGQNRVRETIGGHIFMLPAILVLATFYMLPAIRLFLYGFTDFSLMLGSGKFVGLDNYRRILVDNNFHNSLKVSLKAVLMIVPIQTFVALVMAVFVNQKLRGVQTFRTIYFTPAIISFVAVCVMFQQIYSPTFGLGNTLIEALGLPRLRFLDSTSQALPSMVFVGIWKSWGYFMIIFLSGLQDIPHEIREAAKIDGAGPIREFFYITIPQLKNVTLFVIIITTMDSLKLFIPPFVMTSGNPRNATDLVVHHIYRQAFRLEKVGYAAAMSTILFLVIVGITIIQFRIAARNSED